MPAVDVDGEGGEGVGAEPTGKGAGKVDGTSVSGSSQLVRLAEDGSHYQVTLYAPPKPTAKPPFAGFCTTLAVTLPTDGQGIVTEVIEE